MFTRREILKNSLGAALLIPAGSCSDIKGLFLGKEDAEAAEQHSRVDAEDLDPKDPYYNLKKNALNIGFKKKELDDLIENYNPHQGNYPELKQHPFGEHNDEIRNLNFLKYLVQQSLKYRDEVWDIGDVEFRIDSYARFILEKFRGREIAVSLSECMLDMYSDDIEKITHKHREHLQRIDRVTGEMIPAYPDEKELSPDERAVIRCYGKAHVETIHLNYLLYYVQREAFEKSVKVFDKKWEEKPWKKIKSDEYKKNKQDISSYEAQFLAYDENTKEFVFIGKKSAINRDCGMLAQQLVLNKIAFREIPNELNATPRPPFIVYAGETISGFEKIMEKVKIMYGL